MKTELNDHDQHVSTWKWITIIENVDFNRHVLERTNTVSLLLSTTMKPISRNSRELNVMQQHQVKKAKTNESECASSFITV